jgi:hypothetical protein
MLSPEKPRAGRPPKNYRPIVNGILWVVRTGAPWRDLPREYGPWQTVATQFKGGIGLGSGGVACKLFSSKPMRMGRSIGSSITWIQLSSGHINTPPGRKHGPRRSVMAEAGRF